MSLSADDLATLWLTIKLASTTTLILLVLATPLAWWLATTHSRWRAAISAVVALPLVLPPTVLGFYLLISLGPHGVIGELTSALGIGYLPFHFSGLVLASVCYSLPFVVQPLQAAMQAIPRQHLEAAASLGAGPYDRFISVVLPLAKPGFISAGLLGFAHTVGEFGVVLMIGGNIPGETRVASVALYDHVEAMHYEQAHTLAAVLLIFSFVTLLMLYSRSPAALSRIGP
ncbi:molybdate transport system permease protein [Paraperlucidibaca baekdonensis]|uniref:Molybdenum transport system permease n=1 Tax=Paraperlucidibaca baekdonensis TaxID=748120 RepID=A0A3E0H629_9GAMM|nr:molybdate ABC transporter permease subunit [Paraperlucidibaca baekdonensis]REH38971.1 molybdate transport system permease protein [Paraperlucidibaca baekdonensis]